ncbi:MAG TPA: hypothetical protein VNS60_03640 [Solirubrobacterales bacterium]|nr:hypothetical protein [Solirubrobacterales bacterium]
MRPGPARYSGYWGKVLARAGLDFEWYLASKHYGVWYLWTKVGLSKRAIAAQAGWEESTVDKMLKVYGHGEVGALDEIDAAFAGHVPALRALKGRQGVLSDAIVTLGRLNAA